MKRVAMTLAFAVTTWGCGLEDGAAEFRKGFPEAKTVRVEVPGGAQALTAEGVRQDGLEGDKAQLYTITRGVTATLNGGTVGVLGLVKGIASHPPTRLTATEAVWGPWTEPLSPNTYRFTVTRQADGATYAYVLEARGKTETDAAFRAILSGEHEPAKDAAGAPIERFGAGRFLVDWDQAKTLPEHDDNVGRGEFEYARRSESSDVTIAIELIQVKDDDAPALVDASYRYTQATSGQGHFDFEITKDIDGKPALEVATIRSRWLASGAGRGDMRAKAGDLPVAAELSECWDEGFASLYLYASYAPQAGWGQASACEFETAEFSSL